MIQLGQDGALVVVGMVAVFAVGWSSYVSVRSAAAGPGWALEHLARMRPVFYAAGGAGLVSVFFLSPVWTGFGVVYVVAAVTFLASMLRRSLLRIQTLDGFDEIPAERRRAIVGRARTAMMVLGFVLAVLGGGGLAVAAGPLSWVVLALGATLVGTAALLTREPIGDG